MLSYGWEMLFFSIWCGGAALQDTEKAVNINKGLNNEALNINTEGTDLGVTLRVRLPINVSLHIKSLIPGGSIPIEICSGGAALRSFVSGFNPV